MDMARLGLAVDSSQVEKGTVSLQQLTGAAGQASAAATRLAAASNVDAAGQKTAAAATQVHTAALQVQNTVIRSSMQQRTMMIYQLNDVGVSLASGMNPMMVAIQQGSQILQGGFAPALRTITDLTVGFIAKFWPVALAIGAVSAAIGGLTYEINKTADVQVGFFDVALAGWQMFADMISSIVAPVFGQIGTWMQQGWDAAAPILKGIGNTIIGTFVGAFDAVLAVWTQLPSAMGDIVYSTAQNVVTGLTWMVNEAIVTIQGMIAQANALLQGMGLPGLAKPELIKYQTIDNPYAGAASNAGGSASDAFGSAMGRDYMGGMFEGLSERAQAIALARKETEELGGAASAANDNVKKLADDGMDSLAKKAFNVADGLRSAFQGIGSGIFDAFKKGGDVASSVLDMLMSKLEQFGSSWLDNIINNGIDALFGSLGGFGMGSGMSGISSITGSSGGFFPGFAGGGYTGSGSRSGGLDGQGGFMAMLHPQETVVDHTRQAANQNQRPQVSFSTNIINNAGVEVIENTVDDGQGGVRQEITLNRAVAQQIAKPGAANSAVRGVGRLVRR